MQTSGTLLGSKAFGEHAATELIVAYQSHQDSLRSLAAALEQPHCIALLQGPAGAGKATAVKQLGALSGGSGPVALGDGVNLTPRQLLNDVLGQFGVQATSQDDEQLLQQLDNYVSRETRTAAAPNQIVDDADRVTLSTLRLLNWLAALEASGSFALRMVLTGRQRMSDFVADQSLRNLARRNPATYSLNPLTTYETMVYVRTRLLAAGGQNTERVFPIEVCDRLHEESRGWPGALNMHARDIIDSDAAEQAERPVPRIIVSCDGDTIDEHALTQHKYIIGRSELADIVVQDPFVSKQHAILHVYSNAIILIDLNSTNGTTVNSVVVPKAILRSDDVIQLGRHTLKIENAPEISEEVEERLDTSETQVMQTLGDFRRIRARRLIAAQQHKAG